MKQTIISIIVITVLYGCGGSDDDEGTCTIFKAGDNVVIRDISLGKCQDRFINEPGATGWKWEAD